MSSSLRLCFTANSAGVIQEVQLSEPVSRAYDIMIANGVPPQTAADLAAAAERGGKDPVAFAEHFVKLRRSHSKGRDHGFQ